MNLFRTITPAVKRSNLSLKIRLIEGATELRKSLICQKGKFQRQI